MKTDKSDFIQFAAQMLNEMAETAIKLDMKVLAYLLTMAVQEAGDIENCSSSKIGCNNLNIQEISVTTCRLTAIS
jgi:hypothetical protein